MCTRSRPAKTSLMMRDDQPGFSDMLWRKDDLSSDPNMNRQRKPSKVYETRQIPIVIPLA